MAESEEAPASDSDDKVTKVPVGWLGTNNPMPTYGRIHVVEKRVEVEKLVKVMEPSLSTNLAIEARDWIKSRTKSVWSNLRADITFCRDAFTAAFAEGWWSKMIATLSHLNKIVSAVLGTTLLAFILGLYVIYFYPVAGKSGTAIIGLLLLILGLLVTIRVTRRLYEKTSISATETQGQLLTMTGQVEELNKRLNETAGELTELKEKIRPRLKVSYDKGRYNQTFRRPSDGKVFHRVIRLRLTNLSKAESIRGIRVKAKRFDADYTSVQQVPSRICHNLWNEKNLGDGFSLGPEEVVDIDLVQRNEGEDYSSLCHLISGDYPTQKSKFEITAVITADGQPKQEKTVRVKMDETELLKADALQTRKVLS